MDEAPQIVITRDDELAQLEHDELARLEGIFYTMQELQDQGVSTPLSKILTQRMSKLIH